MVTLGHYLIVSGMLFTIGFAGVLLRRNIIIIFMSLELMLNAANLSLVAFFTKSWPRLSSFISVAAVLASFAISCAVFASGDLHPPELTWIDLKPVLHVPLGIVLDDLAKTMLLIVTGIGAVIHVYSLGYMREDSSKSRYFASLSFFMFSMLGIVVANNFV